MQLLYTGDFSRQEDRHLMAAEIPSVKPDILITVSHQTEAAPVTRHQFKLFKTILKLLLKLFYLICATLQCPLVLNVAQSSVNDNLYFVFILASNESLVEQF